MHIGLGAIKVHDSLMHYLYDYLHFLHDTCTLMLDVSRVGKRMNKAHVKKIEWKNIDSGRPRRSKEPRGGAYALIIFNIIQRYKINQSSP